MTWVIIAQKNSWVLCCKWERKEGKSVIVPVEQVYSVPLGGVSALLDILMKAAVAIESTGPGHLFSLTVRISLGFTRWWWGADHLWGSEWNEQCYLSRNYYSVYRPILRSAHFIWCTAFSMHIAISTARVCCSVSLILSLPSYYHTDSSEPTWVSDVTCLLSEL